MSKPQKQTIHGPIVTTMSYGQRYIDEPVLEDSYAFVGRDGPIPVKTVRYYIRTPLNWKKPEQLK